MIESNNFIERAKEKNSNEYLNQLGKNNLIIYSPTSLKKEKICNKYCKLINWHDITKEITKINKFIENNREISSITSYGGGSAIDIAKYIAYKLNINYICIPTMLSTNSYATDKVALIMNNKKITLNAKLPNEIIVDNELLKLSREENIYGLADVLSIFTALYDWKISDEDNVEIINEYIYKKSSNLLERTLNFIMQNSLENISNNNIKLFKLIGEAGYITNVYGTGRPESGSEHILAKEIEKRINIPHGIAVSIGIVIMSIIQNQNNENIIRAIIKLKILNKAKIYGLNINIIRESLKGVHIREDRYTIVYRKKPLAIADAVIYEFENIIRKNEVKLN